MEKIWIGFRFIIKCFITPLGKFEAKSLSQLLRMWQLVELSCWHTTVSAGRQQNYFQLQEIMRNLRVPFIVNKHCTNMRRRGSALTMHGGEQITTIKNGKFARSRKQNSLTDSESTGLKNCTVLKWSTTKLNLYRNWRSSSFVYTECCCERTVNQSRKVLIVVFSYDHTLDDFKSILALPPMWEELKKLWSYMILFWPKMPASVN